MPVMGEAVQEVFKERLGKIKSALENIVGKRQQ
jgi:hypothetical protein